MTTDTAQPLLTQRRHASKDVETGPAVEVKPKRDSEVEKETVTPTGPPPTDLNRFYDAHPRWGAVLTWLPPIFCIWLYVKSLIVMEPYRPTTHWPEPVASVAAACIKAADNSSMCENIFTIQASMLTFCVCGALNGVLWVVLWKIVCFIRGVRILPRDDFVLHAATGVSLGTAVLGIMCTAIATLIMLVFGYLGAKCDKDDLPMCAYGFNPVFFRMCELVLIETFVCMVIFAAVAPVQQIQM